MVYLTQFSIDLDLIRESFSSQPGWAFANAP